VLQKLKEWIADREDIQWELHVEETPRDFWTVAGIYPPPQNSEEEKRWKKENKPTPWESKI
jgi:hypothetical protein